MEESDASINVSEETAVSIFRVKIKNMTPCSIPNYLTRIPEDSDLCKNKKLKLPVSVHPLRYSGSLKSLFRRQFEFLPVSIFRPILKYFKERKRNEFFPEVVVGTVDITLKKFPRSNHNTQY
jgi:hypothetical protein